MNWKLPHNLPQQGNVATRLLGRFLFTLFGWKIAGELPNHKKMIVAVAPHTSNWDFFIAIFFVLGTGVNVSFMGKHTIFVFPVKSLLKWLGGIPINRSKSHGMVKQMVEQFETREHLILGIAPEGTRYYTKDWKKGFLHISKAAQVPLTILTLDYPSKTLQIGPDFGIADDIDENLIAIKKQADRAQGKVPKNYQTRQ
jgi:1-acyl-sn-glycerol-3-phosphate acyltransferase